MNVLIVNGISLLGTYLSNKLYQEGYGITIADNKGKSQRVLKGIKYNFFDISIDNADYHKLFNSNSFDMLIYLDHEKNDCNDTSIKAYINEDYLYLITLLELCESYKVGKLVHVKKSSIYAESDEHKSYCDYKEKAENLLFSKYKKNMMICQEIFVSNIYSTTEKDLVFKDFLSTYIAKRKLNELKEYDFGRLYNFMHVKDMVEGIYQSISNNVDFSKRFLISNYEYRLGDIDASLDNGSELKKTPCAIKYKEKNEMKCNLNILHDLSKDIIEIDEFIDTYLSLFKEDEIVKEKKSVMRFIIKLKPLIENIFLFVLATLANRYFMGNDFSRYTTVMDFYLVYIAIIGIVYGRRQGILAIAFSTVSYLIEYLSAGLDIAMLFYESTHLVRILLYMLIGFTTGYTIDSKNNEIFSYELKHNNLEEKYLFLSDLYDETSQVKKDLQVQINNTKDSFGKLYKVLEHIQSLDVEQIYSSSVQAFSSILGSGFVAIYSVNHDITFLRLKARSKELEGVLRKTIDLKTHEFYKESIKKQSIFINYKLKSDLPMLAATVYEDDRPVCIIGVYQVAFDVLTLHYQNLFKIMVKLFSGALKRASEYETKVENERYVQGTRVLRKDYFEKARLRMQKTQELHGMKYVEVILKHNKNIKTIYKKIDDLIRDDDLIGICDDKYLHVIYYNVFTKNDKQTIFRRLKENGIEFDEA